MNILAKNIKPAMILSGIFTCSMVYVVISPGAALQSIFGDTLSGPVAEIIARDWGALITMVGILLIYGAFRPDYRTLIIVSACATKIVFVALVLSFGQPVLESAWPAITFDSIVVVILSACLLLQPKAHKN